MAFSVRSRCLSNWKPYPCGHYGDTKKECRCTPLQIRRYRNKISGPLLDRIDIHTSSPRVSGIDVPRVEYEKLSDARLGESSASVQERVEAARDRQRVRFGSNGITSNAEMHPADIRKFCALDATGQSLKQSAMNQMQLLARGYHRVLKLARTIADLAGSESIQPSHLAEALQYRPKNLMV
jgi:magnesium chelatase family protein